MAIKILTPAGKGHLQPEIDNTDPGAIAEKKIRHDDRHGQDAAGNKIDRLPAEWTIPPISNSSPKLADDNSQSLEMGVIYHIKALAPYFVQNICENEDDKVEFSLHGDADGTWGKLGIGNMVKGGEDLFLLNRTNYENMRVAIIEAE